MRHTAPHTIQCTDRLDGSDLSGAPVIVRRWPLHFGACNDLRTCPLHLPGISQMNPGPGPSWAFPMILLRFRTSASSFRTPASRHRTVSRQWCYPKRPSSGRLGQVEEDRLRRLRILPSFRHVLPSSRNRLWRVQPPNSLKDRPKQLTCCFHPLRSPISLSLASRKAFVLAVKRHSTVHDLWF